jgi:hypothetical protein
MLSFCDGSAGNCPHYLCIHVVKFCIVQQTILSYISVFKILYNQNRVGRGISILHYAMLCYTKLNYTGAVDESS